MMSKSINNLKFSYLFLEKNNRFEAVGQTWLLHFFNQILWVVSNAQNVLEAI